MVPFLGWRWEIRGIGEYRGIIKKKPFLDLWSIKNGPMVKLHNAIFWLWTHDGAGSIPCVGTSLFFHFFFFNFLRLFWVFLFFLLCYELCLLLLVFILFFIFFSFKYWWSLFFESFDHNGFCDHHHPFELRRWLKPHLLSAAFNFTQKPWWWWWWRSRRSKSDDENDDDDTFDDIRFNDDAVAWHDRQRWRWQ